MTYAAPTDVAKFLRGSTSVTGTEAVQWQSWLSLVERSIERAFRKAGLNLAAAIAAGDPDVEHVKDVEVAAVIRKIQNPTWGETSRTESHGIDDANGSYTTRNEGAGAYADPLALLPDELAALLPAGEVSATSTRPSFQRDTPCQTVWLPS